jgi:copper resistance protein D
MAAPALWFAVISLHIIAATAWIGGMLFLSLILAPLVRSRTATGESVALFRAAARRFRLVVWVAMATLLTTGPLLLLQRNVGWTDPSAWPQIVAVKLALVAVLLVLTLSHDLLLGPKVSQLGAIPDDARTAWEKMVIRTARWLPRLSLFLALAVVVAAVIVART